MFDCRGTPQNLHRRFIDSGGASYIYLTYLSILTKNQFSTIILICLIRFLALLRGNFRSNFLLKTTGLNGIFVFLIRILICLELWEVRRGFLRGFRTQMFLWRCMVLRRQKRGRCFLIC